MENIHPNELICSVEDVGTVVFTNEKAVAQRVDIQAQSYADMLGNERILTIAEGLLKYIAEVA